MKLIEIFRKDATGQVDLASLMREIKDEEVINNPNNVKVVTDQNDFALYFSRSVIPYPREQNVGVRCNTYRYLCLQETSLVRFL
jgi:3-deoxy-manno-octulosonate cytidylyltransferase (CMP-KDO synthetase)